MKVIYSANFLKLVITAYIAKSPPSQNIVKPQTIIGSFTKWYIGITNDPKRRKGEHKVEDRGVIPEYWRSWVTGSSKVKKDGRLVTRTDVIARKVERFFFREIKMQDGGDPLGFFGPVVMRESGVV